MVIEQEYSEEEDFFLLVEELFKENEYTYPCPKCEELVTLSPEEVEMDLGIDIRVDIDKIIEEVFTCPYCQVPLMVINTNPLEFESLDYEEEFVFE